MKSGALNGNRVPTPKGLNLRTPTTGKNDFIMVKSLTMDQTGQLPCSHGALLSDILSNSLWYEVSKADHSREQLQRALSIDFRNNKKVQVQALSHKWYRRSYTHLLRPSSYRLLIGLCQSDKNPQQYMDERKWQVPKIRILAGRIRCLYVLNKRKGYDH